MLLQIIDMNISRLLLTQCLNIAVSKCTNSIVKFADCKRFKLYVQNRSVICKSYFVNHYRLMHQNGSPMATENFIENTFKKRKKHHPIYGADMLAMGFYNVSAFATAEEYDLENLLDTLQEQNVYKVLRFFSTDNLGLEQDVLYVAAESTNDKELSDIFFFREGSVVLWNFSEAKVNDVLCLLKPFEKDPYLNALVYSENEVMSYTYIPASAIDIEGDLVQTDHILTANFQNGKLFLTNYTDNFLPKYTFSNALSTSVKLGIWEATLDRYINSMKFITNDMKNGRPIRISRSEVLRKTGELLTLRHLINLSSDLLDTPDFYWDREELERLYLKVCTYFAISRRTKVMNEKINHCVELAELISHNLNEAHNTRLEWMIIILIMIEVCFEVVHYVDRYYGKETERPMLPLPT